MDSFSISQLSQFSGIKPHTIRIWERRYNALTPGRSVGNTRYYDSSQLRRLLNIVSMVDSDHKISELCLMPDEQIFELLKSRIKQPAEDQTEYLISQLILAGISYDEIYFDKILSHSLIRYGMKECYTRILYPMLVRIGLMWASDTIPTAREHFISNCIRKKLFTSIDSLPPPSAESDTWLLFLPENEFHEIGLLLACYLIRLSGQRVIYLGANVPLPSLSDAINDIKPRHLLLFFVHHDIPENLDTYLKNLSLVFHDKIFLAASDQQVQALQLQENVHHLSSVQQLLEQLPTITV
ncbi:cobalamin B12-binding domain-containing protein [Flavihumibacter sp. R14]|nr:cobalamin B12-binding domain-containing protein [Flavihumibacter soli]